MSQRTAHHRIATTLAGLMAAAGVHLEITAVPIHASSQPDWRAIGYRATR